MVKEELKKMKLQERQKDWH